MLNINKAIKYGDRLIKLLEKYLKNKDDISENFHNDIIDFCVISCVDNKNYYKKIDIDFSKVNKTLIIKSKNYSSGKKERIIVKDEHMIELMKNELKILHRIRDYLERKRFLESK